MTLAAINAITGKLVGEIFACSDCKGVVTDSAAPGALCVGGGVAGAIARVTNSGLACN